MASTTNWKIGTAINYQKAAEYYQLAADRGDITVNCLLGSLYERGLGVPQDYAKAEEHYTISAERGDIIASGGWASLDNLYETRMDGARDYDVARIWYQKAADIGNLDGVALAGPLPYATLGSREKSEPYGDVLHIRPAFGPCPSRSDGFGKHEGQSVWASIAPPGRRGVSPCSRGR